MPQAATQTPTDENTPYTAVDPKKQPLEFIIQNKDALARMPEKKQMRFIDLAFRRFALPRYQSVNKQIPLSAEETEKLRVQFAARLLGIPSDPTQMEGPLDRTKPGILKKGAAALSGGGAGVLGGLRTIQDLNTAIERHLGPIGDIAAYKSGLASQAVGKIEGKAYEEAQLNDPKVASVSAAIGHQIPASIAGEGAGGLVPKLAAGAPTALKVAAGAAKGATEGMAFGAATPAPEGQKKDFTGDISGMGTWGGVIGAAFPLLARMFGRGGGATAVEGAAKTEVKAAEAAPASPKVKPTLESMKAEIAQQQAQKKAEKAAKIAAKRAERTATEGEKAAQRTQKAQEAEATAKTQAEKRASGGTSKATAAAAVSENPQIKVSAIPEKGGINVSGSEKAMKENTPSDLAQALRVENDELKGRLKPETSEADRKVVEDRIKQNESHIAEYDKQAKPVTKVAEGEHGKMVSAKGGKPGSPAKQAVDRERIAAKRELAKAGEFGTALEKHAQEMAGRYSGKTIGIESIPEIEDTVKEFEGGEMILKSMQKLRRAGQIDDVLYVEELKEWLLTRMAGE